MNKISYFLTLFFLLNIFVKAQINTSNKLKVYPNDFLFDFQLGLDNNGYLPYIEDFSFEKSKRGADIDMPKAWAIEQGSPDIVLAVIDRKDGFKLDHKEFEGRLWINKVEVPGNGIDDDGNGVVDDIHGVFSYADNNGNGYLTGNLPTPNANHLLDFVNQNHPTTVAAVAMANANNHYGIAGVDWNCKLMTIPFAGDGISFYNAVKYAVDNGAHVINVSYVFSETLAVKNAVKYAHDNNVLIVASMEWTDADDNLRSNPFNYLTKLSLEFDNVISVGATNPDDTRSKLFLWGEIGKILNNDNLIPAGGSSYGEYIDVVAPGNFVFAPTIYSKEHTYFLFGGTSYAAPIVSGIATLLLAQDPTRTPAEIRHIIRTTAEDMVGRPEEDTPGFDIYHGYGRVNAFDALNYKFTHVKKESRKKDLELIVYTNPSTDYIFLEVDGAEINANYIVFDQLGILYSSGMLIKDNETTMLDIKGLQKGVYWVQITTNDGTTLSKNFRTK